jgi:hypothetical protein
MKSSFWLRNRLKGATRPEAIFTEAETLPELKERVRDAVRCHFDEARRPRIIRLHLVKDEFILV